MFELSAYHLLLAGFGLAVALAYWAPRFVSGREPAASALLIGLGFLIFGFAPGVPQAISPAESPRPWEIVSELCVIAGLFGVGMRIDNLAGWRAWRPTVRLLLLAMPITIAALVFLGVYAAGLSLAAALLLGAVLAPTDPVLAGDVQVAPPTEGGEHPVRFALTTEAGLNDGLAFPFVHLALALAAVAAAELALPSALLEWAWRDVLYRIVVGATAGVGMGWLLGKLLFSWPRENALARTEAGVVALAGVLVTYGVTELVEGYGFIAAFAAGLTLRRQESEHDFHSRLHSFVENIEHALTAVLLVALGAALPALLPALGWTEAALALALILVVRPLGAWLSLGRTLQRTRERAVVAFYGIRGVGSIYYLAYAGSHTDFGAAETRLWAIVAFAILVSTVVHGFSAGIAVERATGEGAEQKTFADT